MYRVFTLLVVAFAALVMAAPSAGQTQKTKFDPNQPYQAEKSDPVIYDVEFAAVVTPPLNTKVLKVWMPVPQDDGSQEVTASKFSTFPMEVKPTLGSEKKYNNRFAYFEFKNPEGAQIIKHQFMIKVWELRWNLDSKKVVKVESWPASFDNYLKGDDSVVVDDRFREVARKTIPNPGDQARDLAEIMDWVGGYMRYDSALGSLRASSEHALKTKAGHCSDYHGLCASVGRALGYPTRVTYGILAFPKNSPSHCKLDAYLPPYGWVTFDVSETYNLIGAIKKDEQLTAKEKTALTAAALTRLRTGFRDNTFYLQTRGTDYHLEPKAAKRVPLVRTIYAEADGVALPEPDPANAKKREYSWMTAHKYTPSRTVSYPFKDFKSLAPRK